MNDSDRTPSSAATRRIANGRLDVVIVSWNAGAFLNDCVDSVLASACAGFELGEVVVVDNASTDGSWEHAQGRWGTRVRLVRNARNLGFARACNLGARYGEGEWLLFLNPDTRLFSNSLSHAVHAIKAREAEGVRVCGIRLIDDEGKTARTCARFPNWWMLVIASLALDRVSPRYCRSHIMREWDHASSRHVDHVIGAFYLVDRVLFEELRGFDEQFFVYLEDLDLSRRIAARGFRSYFCAETHAYHKGGGTSRAILARRLFFAQRSRLQYARKHLSLFGASVVAFATLIVEPIVRLSHAIISLHFRDAGNVALAYGLLYGSILGNRDLLPDRPSGDSAITPAEPADRTR